jgi:hypothetical protein
MAAKGHRTNPLSREGRAPPLVRYRRGGER